jgi:ubiquinone/menaquinone biosynthesis C-methylase UbiE
MAIPADEYDAAVAHAFSTFAADTDGEKALVWSVVEPYLRKLDKGGRLLDFGCGTGWLALRAAQNLQLSAHGYDPAPAMIAEAKKSDPQNIVSFTTSLHEVPTDLPMVIALFVPPAIADTTTLQRAFIEMAGQTAPGGTVLVITTNPSAAMLSHAFYQSRILNAPLAAGVPYAVDLLKSDGTLLVTVTDTFWPVESIKEAAAAATLTLAAEHVFAEKNSPADARDEQLPYRLYVFTKTI